MTDNENKVPERADRLKKLEELRTMGVEPYPLTYPVDTRTA